MLVAEDIADLFDLVWTQPSREAAATVARVIERHDAAKTCLKLSDASRVLGTSVPTVTVWLERGALEGVTGLAVQCVSASSVGWALSALRRSVDPSENRARLARVLDSLSNREALLRAKQLRSETRDEDLVTLSEDDFAALPAGG
jgi:hypothetical protein